VLTTARPSVTQRTSIAPNEALRIAEHVLNQTIAPHPGRMDASSSLRHIREPGHCSAAM
jgi:hypothetical protein